MKNKLKNIIIALNRYKIGFWFFKIIYKIQLFITKWCFKSQKCFVAMILRRQNVVFDCYPPNSDYDITCIVDSKICSIPKAVAKYARIYRFLKKMLFPLGEMKLIDIKDFSHHIYYNWINYYDCPGPLYFLYKKNDVTLAYEPKKANNICLKQRIYHILFSHVSRQNYTSGIEYKRDSLFFSRDLCKNAEKMKVFAGYLKGESDSINVNYNELPEKENNFMLSAEEKMRIVNNCEKIISHDLPAFSLPRDFTFKIKGNPDFLSKKNVSSLDEALFPFLEENRQFIEKLFICNYRLYKTCKVIFLQRKDNLSFDEKSILYNSVSKICGNLEPFDQILIKPFPVIVDSSTLNKFNLIEQFSAILSDCIRYDFLQEKFVYSSQTISSISKDFLYMCLSEAVDLINSYTRNRNSLYVIELIFGHLMAYNYLLENNILYGNFEEMYNNILKGKLSAQQTKIIDLYRAENYVKLSKIDSLKVWKTFQNFIIEEMGKSSIILDKNMLENN